MTRYTKLKGRMFELGVTQIALQKVIGRGQGYVTARINGHKPWNAAEMARIGAYLEIPKDQWADYFM